MDSTTRFILELILWSAIWWGLYALCVAAYQGKIHAIDRVWDSVLALTDRAIGWGGRATKCRPVNRWHHE